MTLQVNKVGSGPPMLLVHGFASSAFTWRHIVRAFQDRFTVWPIDLVGHGKSPKPRDFDYTIESQARVLCELIDREKLDNLTLIGHSYGGAVSLRTSLDLIARDSNPLRRMVLIGAAAYEQDFPPFIKILRRPILGRILPHLVPPGLSGRKALRFAYHDLSRITPDQVEGWGAPMRERGIHHSLRQTALNIVPKDIDSLTSMYPSISIPSQLIWGRQDVVVPLTVGERLNEALPSSNLHVMDDCGHIPHEEMPDETIEVIDKFLH